MGFGPPDGDSVVEQALDGAAARGAMTFALPGARGSYAIGPAADDPFVHQEIIEILYHTLWETVHVFLERRELGHDVGDAGFLYPFLGRDEQPHADAMTEVASSIRMKVAEDVTLRAQVARDQSDAIGEAALAIHRAPAPRREADPLRQRRVGNRCQRLDARLRQSASRDTGGSPRSRSRWSRPASPPSPTTSAPTSFSFGS